MRRIGHTILLAMALLSVLVGSLGWALEMNISVHECAGVPRKASPLSGGIPFAKGQLRDVSKLVLLREGQVIPAQFVSTVRWDDGSIRWTLLDAQLDVAANERIELTLSDRGGNRSLPNPLKVSESGDGVKIVTGQMEAFISRKAGGFLTSLKLGGRELLGSTGRGLVLINARDKEVVADAPEEIAMEHSGPMRAVVRLRGRFPGEHNGLLTYTTRLTFFAGLPKVLAHVWLENGGARGLQGREPEWFEFDGMAVELALRGGGAVRVRCEGVEVDGKFKLLQRCNRGDARVGYTYNDLNYVINGPTGELKTGQHTDGVCEVIGNDWRLMAAVLDFWENYEKAIELDGTIFRIWLWPTEGVWPRPSRGRESKYAKGLEKLFAPKDRYFLPGGVHKGHIFVLDFDEAGPERVKADLVSPLFPWCGGERYAESGALPFLFGPAGIRSGDRECDLRLATWERMSRAVSDPGNETSLLGARKKYMTFQIGYKEDSSIWYGWMDFGDICLPGAGMISLGRDWPRLVLSDFLRTGSAHSFKLASEMIRHRVDIDQYWSDRDPPTVNRVQSGAVWPAFHAGGKGPAPGATHIAGLVLWYMLTGEPKAKEAALRSAEGLVAYWEDALAQKSEICRDMAANGAAISSFCAAYDLIAERKWLDQALKLFNTNVMEKRKARGPHLHTPGRGQLVGQDYLREDAKYLAVIGPLCLLHARTGDAEVLKLLVEGTEKPLPEDSHFDAPAFMGGLYAYVGAVTGRGEFRKQGIETFCQGFPLTKNPQVFLHQNSTWAHDAAAKLHAGEMMAYATWLASRDKKK